MQIRQIVSAAYARDPEATKAMLENDLGLNCQDEDQAWNAYDDALNEQGFDHLDMDPARVVKQMRPTDYRVAMRETSDGLDLDDDQAEESFDDLLREQGPGVLANFNLDPSLVLKSMDEHRYREGFGHYMDGNTNLSDWHQGILPEGMSSNAPSMFVDTSELEDLDEEQLADALLQFSDNTLELPLFQFAAGADCEQLCIDMIEAGVDVNGQLPNGRTALHEAAERGNEDICSYLLEEGANPSLQDNQGRSAIDVAMPRSKAILETQLMEQNTAQASARYATDDDTFNPNGNGEHLAPAASDTDEPRPRSRMMRL